jgi:NitT/TauT family transport system substrate-binding protein
MLGRIASLAVSTLLAAAWALPAQAEANRLGVAKQYGLGYMQLILMEDGQLIEKHAKAANLGDVKVEWATFRSSDVMNDSLIAGTVDFVCVGTPGLATIWSKTRGNIDVRGASGLNALPLHLITRNPNVKSIKDFTEKDRIAVPAVKVAIQAIYLQMEAAKVFGEANYAKLDPLTVSMAHPDAFAALTTGQSEITAHFASPPFSYREMEKPGMRAVLKSYDVIGGKMSFNVIAATNKFRTANPKLYAAFLSALEEATATINKDKRAAAEVYLRVTKDKSPVEEILKMMNDPDIEFTTMPMGNLKMVEFMNQVGTIKVKPASWQDLFFENVHSRAGS